MSGSSDAPGDQAAQSPPSEIDPPITVPETEPADATAATETPEPAPPEREPVWMAFLTPASLIVGAAMISWTIWWTRDMYEPEPAQPVVIEAVSTTPPTVGSGASGASGLLDTVRGYARQLALDEAEFNQCINNQANVAPISRDLQTGNTFGVTGTPTFFINNKKLVGSQPVAILEEIINAELNGSPTSLDGYSAGIRQLAASNPPNFAIVESAPDITGAAIEGDPNARVIVAEFSDFQCPFCKQWTDRSLQQLRARLGKDVALAFLHFPIVQIHPNAGNASLVAVCAGQQGKFWEMHDLLFARQQEWANLR